MDPGIALLYRLSGDYNPLHLDPSYAQSAGYEAPIVHGKCTLGHTCRLLLDLLDGHERFERLQLRYASPVRAGETLQLEVWGQKEESLEGRVAGMGGIACVREDIVGCRIHDLMCKGIHAQVYI